MIGFILVSIIIACLHVFIKIKYSHWSKKSVKGPTPLPFVGNFGWLMLQKQSISQLAQAVYEQFPNERVVGLYCGFKPVLLLRDPDIIINVMTKDFNNFVNRGVRTAEDGFCNNLLVAEDDIWRNLRYTMTPAFTKAKLKQMVPLIDERINKFLKQVEISTESEENCDVKALAERYAMELICSCGFGLNMNFYSDEINKIMKMGKESITPNLFFRLWYAAELLIPGIQRMLPAVDPTAQVRAFFIKLVNHIISERKKVGYKRHDIMEIMITHFEEDKNKHEDSKRKTELDVDFIASQVYVLFVTGFETSSSSLSYLLYELAMHEDVQENAYREICAVLEKYNGNLTYDAITEMSYLQKVFNETLRRHTFVSWIIRKASKDCTLSGTNIKVKAGTLLLVSGGGLHCDPKYFSNPTVFNPDNCSAENLSKIPQCAFIPFGIGPRNCIGFRFATQHVMMAAAAFLRKFKVSPCTDQQRHVEFDSISITVSPVNGIWMKVTKRN